VVPFFPDSPVSPSLCAARAFRGPSQDRPSWSDRALLASRSCACKVQDRPRQPPPLPFTRLWPCALLNHRMRAACARGDRNSRPPLPGVTLPPPMEISNCMLPSSARGQRGQGQGGPLRSAPGPSGPSLTTARRSWLVPQSPSRGGPPGFSEDGPAGWTRASSWRGGHRGRGAQ